MKGVACKGKAMQVMHRHVRGVHFMHGKGASLTCAHAITSCVLPDTWLHICERTDMLCCWEYGV